MRLTSLFLILAICSTSFAEVVRTKSPATVITEKGSEFKIGPSVIVPNADWDKLDAEVRRLQEFEVRKKAEDIERQSQLDSATLGWKSMTAALLLGVAGGYWLAKR